MVINSVKKEKVNHSYKNYFKKCQIFWNVPFNMDRSVKEILLDRLV